MARLQVSLKKISAAFSDLSLQKVVAYFFIIFISLLLIIFFVGTDIISTLGGGSIDPNVVATVNNQKIYMGDLYRFSRQYRDQDIEGQEGLLLNNLIARVLFYQRAKELGIDPSESRVMKFIRGLFRDKNTGMYDPELFKDYLEKSRSSLPDYYRNVYKEVVADEFRRLIQIGITLTGEDLRVAYAFLYGECRVMYNYIPDEAFKSRVMNTISISEMELSAEMAKNKDKYPDEASNRRLTRERLEQARLDSAAKEFLEKINSMAQKGATFNETAAVLGGSTGITPAFMPGDPSKDGEKNPVLSELGKSPNFLVQCMFTPAQKSSYVIATPGGFAVITPLELKLSGKEPEASDLNKIADRISMDILNSAYNRLVTRLSEEAKITKKLKTD